MTFVFLLDFVLRGVYLIYFFIVFFFKMLIMLYNVFGFFVFILCFKNFIVLIVFLA